VPLELLSPIVIVVWALVLTCAERMFPYVEGYRVVRPDFWNDLLMYSLFQSSILAIVIAAIIRWADEFSHLSRLHLVSGFPLWAQLLLFLVTHDLWQYWFHRLQHRNRVLWRTHEAAHAPLHVDWLAGSRSHALEILIAQTMEFAPIFLLGAAPEVPLLKGILDAMWGMFNHCNVRVRMGKLLYVLNGPELHRWHHDLRAPKGGVNLATKFALWDWLWATAYLPEGVAAGEYGLRNNAAFPHGNYFKQFTYAFRRSGGQA
jgi:sterol desaturase/sphingolipid hydroxylase (fatty acid hydroxylase superfamily)